MKKINDKKKLYIAIVVSLLALFFISWGIFKSILSKDKKPVNKTQIEKQEIKEEVKSKIEKKVENCPDGTKEIYYLVNGKKEGKAQMIFRNNDREEYTYKNGIIEGKAVYYFYNGDREEYIYKNGVLNGEAKFIYSNGKKESYKYINGERK